MKKPKVNVRATGKTAAYVQEVSKSGRLSKPKAVVITTVRASAAPVKKAKRRRRS